jgi:ATP-binding cassette subfamily B protein
MMEFINNFVLITIGALMSVFGITDLGTVFAILSIQGNVSAMFMNFGSAWGMVQESISAAEMIEEVFEAVPENYENTTVEKRNSSIAVRFENVIFAYDKEKVLDGISLEVRRGETAALVGNSGGGKSTVIRLMPEFYKICSGHIYIDGADIKSYPLKQLRSKIAYVPQDSYLFEETIMENIRFGKPDASDKEVYEAARLANAHDFIKELPEGYNTITGERGETLSGGQRQRIAIARAFLKDAPILLLDEATSALDKENERLVQQSLETLMKGRTTMVVAHRLSTIRNADVIYVIKNGHVIQKGKHNDLLKEGLYRELVELSERTDGREADRYV